MNMRHRSLWIISALLLLGFLAAFIGPRLLERNLRRIIEAHPSVEAAEIHVQPWLRIDLPTLRIERGGLSLQCQNVQLSPAFSLRKQNPRLRRIEIQHCDIRSQPGSSEEATDHAEEQALHERLQALYQQAATALDITRHVQIDSLTAELQRREHTLTLQGTDIAWRNIDPTNRNATATLRLQGNIQSEAITLTLVEDDTQLRVTIENDAAIEYDEHTLHHGTITLDNWHTLSIPHLRIQDAHPLLAQLAVEDLSVALERPLHIRSKSSVLTMANNDLATPILANARPEPEPAAPRFLVDAQPAEPEHLWSLRTLDRARRLVERLNELLRPDEDRWPLAWQLEDIDLRYEDETLMHIQSFHYGEDEALHIDARIAQASVSLQGNADNSTQWRLHVEDASLQRIASFVELDDHLQGRVDADLELELQDQELRIKGQLALRDGSLHHEGVSPEPVTPLQLQGQIEAKLPAVDNIEAMARYTFTFNDIPLQASLRVMPVAERARFIVELATQESVDCQRMWEAIPAGLLHDMTHDSLRFRGSAQPSLSINYVAGVFDSFALAVDGFPDRCKITTANRDLDPRNLLAENFEFHVTEGVTDEEIFVGPGTGDYVRIDSLPSYIPAVMYLSEEIQFYENPGISIGLINKAIRHSLPRRRFAYGGSTVTQQLVKNLYFTRTKTLSRKLQEAFIVWAMESTLSKDQILELYINCIEFGPNLYGIARASRHYFAKEAQDLTPLEAAWLASLKPSPIRGRRDFLRGYSDLRNWNNQRNQDLLWRLVRYGGHIEADDVYAAAPYVVFFPDSPNAGMSPPGWEERVAETQRSEEPPPALPALEDNH